MNILCITRCFYPHGDASSGVVEALANEFIERKHQVKVLAISSYKEDKCVDSWGKIKIGNEYSILEKNREQIKCEFPKHPIVYSGLILALMINKIMMNCFPPFSRLSINPILLKTYKKIIKKEIENNKYDLCIVTLMPHEAVIAANEVIDNTVPVAIYQLDTYWDNEVLPKKRKADRFAFERKLIEKSFFTITTPQAFTRTVSRCRELERKMIPAEFPLIRECKDFYREDIKKEGTIRCVFLGRLYRDIRPPEKIVEIISKLMDSGAIFEFFGRGQELIVQSEYYPLAKDRIRLKGVVASEVANDVRNASDVLVNIDNTSIQQVPSKIFEYICTGKPIINFYFNKESDTIRYLKNYPASLNVDVNDEKASDQVYAFLKALPDKAIEFSIIREAYIKNTPEYVAEQFLKAYQENIAK